MNTTYLVGAEEVSSAASRISSAAHEMYQAAASIDNSLAAHRLFLDDWLTRFQQTLEDAAKIKQEELVQERVAHSQFGVGA